jgi:hypothetical protein
MINTISNLLIKYINMSSLHCAYQLINPWGNFFFLCRYSPNLDLGLPPWNFPFHFGLLDLRHSVRLLGRVISSSPRPLPVHKHRKTHIHTRTLNIHALTGIRNHDPGFQTSEVSACLRQLGYRDRRGNFPFIKTTGGECATSLINY